MSPYKELHLQQIHVGQSWGVGKNSIHLFTRSIGILSSVIRFQMCSHLIWSANRLQRTAAGFKLLSLLELVKKSFRILQSCRLWNVLTVTDSRRLKLKLLKEISWRSNKVINIHLHLQYAAVNNCSFVCWIWACQWHGVVNALDWSRALCSISN